MVLNMVNCSGNDEDDFLTLRLAPPSLSGPSRTTAPPPSPPPPSSPLQPVQSSQPRELHPYSLAARHSRVEQASLQIPSPSPPLLLQAEEPQPPAEQSHVQTPRSHPNLRNGKSEYIEPPFRWATSRRASVHTMQYLVTNQLTMIPGEVQCRSCNIKYWMEYDLGERFAQISHFIMKNAGIFHDRAPLIWTNPVLPTCRSCGQEGSARPVISDKKRSINWLFLLLGEMLGCCTLEHLKYLCKHTNNHRTGAKNRLLYLAYMELCRQLHPDGPFNHRA